MTLIKNIHLLADIGEKELSMMEHAALEHKRYSSITFKIVEYNANKVIIQVRQDKNAAGVYHNQKRLIEITHETFDRFFTGQILAYPVPFKPSPIQIVDKAWVNNKMDATGIKLKDIAADTGIDNAYLSAVITGDKTISRQGKAMFYYYFLYKQNKTA